MKILLGFLLGTFLVACWAARRERRSRFVPLLVFSIAAAAVFYSQRYI